MKKSVVTLLSSASLLALLIGGCANKEAVKAEETVVPAQSVTKVEPAKPDDAAEKARLAEEARLNAAKNDAKNTSDAKITNTAVEVKFETAYFDYDKAELRQDARNVLSKNAETILKSFAAAKIQIEGHCDERGSAEYNMALGENRAKSAQKYMTTLGVKAENLSIISYGKEKPAVQGSDETAWAKNRRAEFVVVK
jgi:peptidoglycan-associated lipoprotein